MVKSREKRGGPAGAAGLLLRKDPGGEDVSRILRTEVTVPRRFRNRKRTLSLSASGYGAPGATRTPDPLLRSEPDRGQRIIRWPLFRCLYSVNWFPDVFGVCPVHG